MYSLLSTNGNPNSFIYDLNSLKFEIPISFWLDVFIELIYTGGLMNVHQNSPRFCQDCFDKTEFSSAILCWKPIINWLNLQR